MNTWQEASIKNVSTSQQHFLFLLDLPFASTAYTTIKISSYNSKIYNKCNEGGSSALAYSFNNKTDFRVTYISLYHLFYFNCLNRDRNHRLTGNICGL